MTLTADEISYQVAKLLALQLDWNVTVDHNTHRFPLICSSGSPCSSGHASRGRSMTMTTEKGLTKHHKLADSFVLFIVQCIHYYVRQ